METERNFEYTAQLIIKFLKDDLSAAEQADFELWCSSNPEHEEIIQSFRDTAAVQSEIDFIHNVNIAEGFENVLKKINTQKPERRIWTEMLRYASVAMVLIGLSFTVYMLIKPQQASAPMVYTRYEQHDIMPGKKQAFLSLADGSTIDLNTTKTNALHQAGAVVDAKSGTLTYTSPKGGRANGYNLLRTPRAGEYKIVLADGSRVWLNASSSLRFPENFNQRERRVELSGEAYFEVAHNRAKPFIVSFNGTEVKVLGTHFNISTYKAESMTTLIEGAIIIKNGNQQKLLKPGQEAIVLANELSVRSTDTYKSTAWKEGEFYFNGDKMTDILDQVSRWYDVEIVYKGEPDNKKYNGNIRRAATLGQVLEMLNVLSGTKFTLQNRTVTVDFAR